MKLNNALVKKQNKIRIFRHLIHHPGTTRPEIAMDLRLSLPTVGQIVSELVEAGLIVEAGMQASSGGRRAMTLEVEVNARKAIGVDITKNHVGLVAVNLAGDILAWNRLEKPFAETEEYIHELEEMVREFGETHICTRESLLGIGISFPGIINPDKNVLMVSHELQLKKPFRLKDEHLLYSEKKPVYFFNDATAVCMAEVYIGRSPRDFSLLALSNTVGGACVSNGVVLHGANNRSGEVGHVCIVPGGRTCYCGKEGHFDAYCSALRLAEHSKNGTVEGFFEQLEQGDGECKERFEEYLDYLALMVYNLHMVNDYPVVIGGYVGSYLQKYLSRIREKVRELNIFEEEQEYLYLCHYNVEGAAVGSARYFIEKFIDEL
ncbi:MAG: ROK family transcriptional regulator [Lachnospiraceae bacterium]|nr:ROK family transcriptional regulator [Lachnospiraceae bacterium]